MLEGFLECNTCDVSDALDSLSILGQVRGLVPLWPGARPIVGRALTMKLHPHATGSTVIGTLEGIAVAEPGDLIVFDNDGRTDINTFGSIAAYCAKRQGIVGCVTDGVTRDVDGMQELDFPVYGKGVIQTSVRGRTGFVGYQVPVRCGGVDVNPGDVVMADANGVVVVPAALTDEVLRRARFFKDMEAKVKAAVDAGEAPVAVHQRLQYDRLFAEVAEQTPVSDGASGRTGV